MLHPVGSCIREGHVSPAVGFWHGLIKDTEVADVHLVDHSIAEAALDELVNLSFNGNSVRYVVSDERTGNEVAAVIGKTLGKEIPWVVFTDDQLLKGLTDAGLSQTHAKAFVQMGAAQRTGVLLEDFNKNKPAFSKTKLEDFAKEFKAAFNA